MSGQGRVNAAHGGGGLASDQETHLERKERLRKLALENIDLEKDPYYKSNRMGLKECLLCRTLHPNDGSYLTHTQGKKHQTNLSVRAATEAKDSLTRQLAEKPKVIVKKFVKIGRPGYRVTKQKDPKSQQQSLLFQIDLPEVKNEILPRHRIMSSYEQKVENPDKAWQYVIVAAEPYETIAFKIPSRELDRDSSCYWTYWNQETKIFYIQVAFKV